jgi:hypothetical protein
MADIFRNLKVANKNLTKERILFDWKLLKIKLLLKNFTQ